MLKQPFVLLVSYLCRISEEMHVYMIMVYAKRPPEELEESSNKVDQTHVSLQLDS